MDIQFTREIREYGKYCFLTAWSLTKIRDFEQQCTENQHIPTDYWTSHHKYNLPSHRATTNMDFVGLNTHINANSGLAFMTATIPYTRGTWNYRTVIWHGIFLVFIVHVIISFQLLLKSNFLENGELLFLLLLSLLWITCK